MPSNAAYDTIFAANTMVGIVGALDITSSTWFGHSYIHVHHINIIPVSPTTAILMDEDYGSVSVPLCKVMLTVGAPSSMLAMRLWIMR